MLIERRGEELPRVLPDITSPKVERILSALSCGGWQANVIVLPPGTSIPPNLIEVELRRPVPAEV